ncbi:5093_t:CDS:1, partial [Funneliformis caledonium]
ECTGHGQVASLVLIKVQGSQKIFGGYSPIGFKFRPISFNDKNLYDHCTTDSFIFSFENDEDTRNMKISRV